MLKSMFPCLTLSPWDEASLAESVNSGLGRALETLSLNIRWKAVEDNT